ncbi:MAG: hypothetical protein P8N49_06930 [Opitutales bacterium]|nr:hypothetical protein [Opitutales bacterium]
MPIESDFSLFADIDKACTKEIHKLGLDAKVMVIKGGVAITFLSSPLSIPSSLFHLPIRELDFSGCQMPPIEEIKGFNLSSLALPLNCELGLDELNFFRLKRLKAEGIQSNDFGALSDHPLSSLSIPRSNISDIEFTRELNLQHLNLASTGISSLKPLEGATELKKINVFKCNIDDIRPLADCSLGEINLSGNTITDLSSLAGMPVKILEMRATKVESLDPMAGCPLEVLHLPGSPISFIGSIAHCPIRELNLVGLSIKDFECLQYMPLESLSVSPDKLTRNQFAFLKALDLGYLAGPGDGKKQSPQAFFDKYSGFY